MTEKEAIKLVKKQNRQNRIESIKCWFSDYGIAVLIAIFCCILALALVMWPVTLECFVYKDNTPAWLDILCPIWVSIFIFVPLLALFVSGIVGAIKEKRQTFRKQVQKELQIAERKEELALEAEQWIVENNLRDPELFTVLDVHIDDDGTQVTIAYQDLLCENPDTVSYWTKIVEQGSSEDCIRY